MDGEIQRKNRQLLVYRRTRWVMATQTSSGCKDLWWRLTGLSQVSPSGSQSMVEWWQWTREGNETLVMAQGWQWWWDP